MADTNQDFGTDPTVTSEDGWQITDGGMERETTEQVAEVLASRDDDAQPAPATEPDAAVEPDEAVEPDPTVQGAKPVTPSKPVEAAKPAQAGEKPKRTLSGRVEELRREVSGITAEKHRERKELDELRAEKQRLQRELTEMRGGKPADKPAEKPAAAAAPAGNLKRPVWKEYEEADKSWDEYLADQDAYLEQRIERSTGEIKAAFQRDLDALRDRSEQDANEARVESAYRARLSAVREAHKDEWPEIIAAVKDIEVTPFIEDVVRLHPAGADLFYQMGKDPDAAQMLNTFEWTTTMFDAVMGVDNPSALLLHLANTEGEFERIRRMTPAQASFALGVLSSRLSEPAPARANGSRPQGKAISKAPAPIRPVGSASTASDTAAESDDDDDILSWVNRENERDRKNAQSGIRRGF